MRYEFMVESSLNPEVQNNGESTGSSAQQIEDGKKKKSLSMHEDVPIWCDCCSCEAEPYWIEMMEGSSSN